MLIWTGKDIFGSGKEWAQNGLVYLVRVIIAEKDSLHNSAKYLVAVSHPWPNRWLSFMAVHSWDRYAVSPLLLIFINRCGFFFFFSVRKSQLLRTALISLFSSVSGKRKPVAAFQTPRSIQWEQCFSKGMGTFSWFLSRSSRLSETGVTSENVKANSC